jgi:hypothetical protein
LPEGNRSSALFSRQRRTTRSRARDAGSTPGGQTGSSRVIAVMVSATLSRRNGRRPVSISKRTLPNEKMSDLWSTGCARTCSGDM